MPRFAIPIVYIIDADTVEDAKKVVEEWVDENDLNDMPSGTEDILCDLTIETNDEGVRILQLPAHEEEDDEVSSKDDDEEDDFYDGEADDFIH